MFGSRDRDRQRLACGRPQLDQAPSSPSPSSASQVICCGRRHLALVSRTKRALHGGREFLIHLLELLGRVGADPVAGLRDVSPKLREFGWCVAHVGGLGGKYSRPAAGSGGSARHRRHLRLSNQNPARKGLNNRSGVLCSGAPTTGRYHPEQTPQLTEQARNCDHDSSDPCSQAKKQHKITQEHRHVLTPPSLLPCWGHLNIPRNCLHPGTRHMGHNAVKRPKVRSHAKGATKWNFTPG
jgi:hypothetical protein